MWKRSKDEGERGGFLCKVATICRLGKRDGFEALKASKRNLGGNSFHGQARVSGWFRTLRLQHDQPHGEEAATRHARRRRWLGNWLWRLHGCRAGGSFIGNSAVDMICLAYWPLPAIVQASAKVPSHPTGCSPIYLLPALTCNHSPPDCLINAACRSVACSRIRRSLGKIE